MKTETQKHTPGPLKVANGTYEYGAQLKVVPEDRHNRNYFLIGGPDKEANAMLCAAAPELLAAMQKFIAMVESFPQDYELDTKGHGLAVCLNNKPGEDMRAAIAKATNQGD